MMFKLTIDKMIIIKMLVTQWRKGYPNTLLVEIKSSPPNSVETYPESKQQIYRITQPTHS